MDNLIGKAVAGLVFLVFRENSYTRGTVEVSAGQTVVSTGPYAVVRHPMYAGAGILVLATPAALGSWVAIVFSVLLMLAIAVRCRMKSGCWRRNSTVTRSTGRRYGTG